MLLGTAYAGPACVAMSGEVDTRHSNHVGSEGHCLATQLGGQAACLISLAFNDRHLMSILDWVTNASWSTSDCTIFGWMVANWFEYICGLESEDYTWGVLAAVGSWNEVYQMEPNEVYQMEPNEVYQMEPNEVYQMEPPSIPSTWNSVIFKSYELLAIFSRPSCWYIIVVAPGVGS